MSSLDVDTSKRFLFVDGLRGIAAMSVVLFHVKEGGHIDHLLASAPPLFEDLLRYGNLGVPIFFVISGFVISHSLWDKNLRMTTAGVFLLRRSVRLDPPYWAAMAITIAFSFAASRYVSTHHQPHYTAAQLLAHIFYLQDLLGYPPIGTVFWTLCFEFQFYIIFVAILFLFGKHHLPLFAAISLLGPYMTMPSGLFFSLWYGFMLGVMAYIFAREGRIWPLAILSVVALASSLYRSDMFGFACVAATVFIALACRFPFFARFTTAKTLLFAGSISYSLYLIHNPIIGAAFQLSGKFFGQTASAEAARMIISIGGSICAAWLLGLTVERPSQKFSKSLTAIDPLPRAEIFRAKGPYDKSKQRRT